MCRVKGRAGLGSLPRARPCYAARWHKLSGSRESNAEGPHHPPAKCCRVAASGSGRLVSTVSVSSICALARAQGGVRGRDSRRAGVGKAHNRLAREHAGLGRCP